MPRAPQGMPPGRIQALYWTTWRGATNIDAVPGTEASGFNVIHLFHAYAPNEGDGIHIVDGTLPPTAAIDVCRDRGQRVLLSLGGAGAGVLNTVNRTVSNGLIQSVKDINSSMGGTQLEPAFDGIDFNTFEATGARDAAARAEYVYMAQQLKSYFGTSFIISSAPAGGTFEASFTNNGGVTDASLVKAWFDAHVMDYAGLQMYGGAGYTQTVIQNNTSWWIDNVANGDESRIVVGYGYGTVDTFVTSNATITGSFTNLKASYPQLRGAFDWEQSTATAFDALMSALIHDGVEIGAGVLLPPDEEGFVGTGSVVGVSGGGGVVIFPLPTTFPATPTQFADNLNDAMFPWQSADLTKYNNAVGEMFRQVEELAFDTDDDTGWTCLLDVDRCPAYALPFLAQFVGLRLPAGVTEAEARAQIRLRPNWTIGTPDAIVDAAQAQLTGDGLPMLLERAGETGDDAYRMVIVISSADTDVAPGTYDRDNHDSAGIYLAVKRVMNPGTLVVIVTDIWLVSQLEAAGYANLAALEAAFPTIGAMEINPP